MAVSYSVSIPQLGALQQAFARAPEITARAVMTATNQSLVGYQATARQLAPVDTGLLRRSIQLRPAQRRGNVIEGSVTTGPLKYAEYQERGTGLYGPYRTPIRPKKAKVLRFQAGGRTVFARQVRGSRPRWFFRGSVEQNQGRTERNFQAALDDVARQLARGGR